MLWLQHGICIVTELCPESWNKAPCGNAHEQHRRDSSCLQQRKIHKWDGHLQLEAPLLYTVEKYQHIRNRFAHFETSQTRTWTIWHPFLSVLVKVMRRHTLNLQTYCVVVSVLVENICIMYANMVKSELTTLAMLIQNVGFRWFFYFIIFYNVIYSFNGKAEFSAAITPVFRVTRSFRNHSDMQIFLGVVQLESKLYPWLSWNLLTESVWQPLC